MKKSIPIKMPLDKDTAIAAVRSLDTTQKWEVVIQPLKEKRSLNQNDLYFMWCSDMARYFTENTSKKFNKQQMHDLMRHTLLGYESTTIGNTKLQDQLKSTTDLNKEEMYHYMEQVDAWAAEKGCLLPTPDNSYHAKIKEKNV